MSEKAALEQSKPDAEHMDFYHVPTTEK